MIHYPIISSFLYSGMVSISILSKYKLIYIYSIKPIFNGSKCILHKHFLNIKHNLKKPFCMSEKINKSYFRQAH